MKKVGICLMVSGLMCWAFDFMINGLAGSLTGFFVAVIGAGLYFWDK